ncbi:hypothetical protein CR194_16525 [Salipaludibacillus keqinensis]|uniref:Uncharacterized protein n=1 Tax=Salipaludibacillus keqinensis TaxID=2045207 RepID=A0A323T9Y9_9BACI|nr:hypothetical protein [Salipaludibacillus keqinensis]PYZ92432.1 hypothetical protein CR194_16525 [Salipaludibacillus keqinensis]
MSALPGIVYIFRKEMLSSYISFWLIFSAFIFGFYALGLWARTQTGTVEFTTNSDLIVMIYIFVTGTLTVRPVFYYGLSFGGTRKHIYQSIIIIFALFSLVTALIHTIYYHGFMRLFATSDVAIQIESIFIMGGLEPSVIGIFLLQCAIFMLFISLGFLLSLVKYHFGSIGLYIAAALFLTTILVPVFNSYWGDLGRWISQANEIQLTFTTIGAILLVLLIPLTFIKRISSFHGEKSG